MTFPAHDEIRIKRMPTGFLTELYKDGLRHTQLFDAVDGVPKPEKVIARLMLLMELCDHVEMPT